jgi:uncharacterized SAM-binding protein YcdF (DUF218 family)
MVPSYFILTLTVFGLLLWRTQFAKSGRRIVISSIYCAPLGTAFLLPLENHFPPWDSSRGTPTGVIVLGGAINLEVSVQRGEVSLGEAAKRITTAVELYHRYPGIRIVFAGGSTNVLFQSQSEAEFAG